MVQQKIQGLNLNIRPKNKCESKISSLHYNKKNCPIGGTLSVRLLPEHCQPCPRHVPDKCGDHLTVIPQSIQEYLHNHICLIGITVLGECLINPFEMLIFEVLARKCKNSHDTMRE